MDPTQKKVTKASKRRRKNRVDSSNDSSEENMSIPNIEERESSFGIHKTTPEEEKKKSEMVLKHKIAAFDEDYAAFKPTIVFK